MEYELSHGIHKVKEVPKPVNIPNFEEIDIGEYAAIAPPKKLDVRNTLKSKKTNSSVSSCSSNLTTHHAISLKASFPSTFGKDSRTSSEQSIVMEKSMQLKNCPKTSGFQDVNTSTDDRDETGDTNESSGKQMHRSIVINHKEKGRSKLSVV